MRSVATQSGFDGTRGEPMLRHGPWCSHRSRVYDPLLTCWSLWVAGLRPTVLSTEQRPSAAHQQSGSKVADGGHSSQLHML